MSNELKTFNSPEFGNIRVMEIDGEPWFVGKDVATALGYSNPRDALAKHVDDEDKQLVLRSQIATLENYIPKGVLPVECVNGEIPNRGLVFINESGLYSLVLSSRLPGAKKFKRWVTSEILPSIRKHSGYLTPEKVDEILSDPDTIIRLALQLKEERAKRTELQSELDRSKEWYSIKRVAAMNDKPWRTYDWRRLKRKSDETGIGVKKIFDANYGEVNTYHMSVWESVYPEAEL